MNRFLSWIGALFMVGSVGEDRTARIWDVETGALLHTLNTEKLSIQPHIPGRQDHRHRVF